MEDAARSRADAFTAPAADRTCARSRENRCSEPGRDDGHAESPGATPGEQADQEAGREAVTHGVLASDVLAFGAAKGGGVGAERNPRSSVISTRSRP